MKRFFLAAGVLLAACSTNSKKRSAWIIGSFATGAAIGSSIAPKDERQDMHAVFWGSLAGVGAALITNSIYNDEDQISLLQKDNQKLKAELDLIQAGNKILLDQGKGKFKNPAGEAEVGAQRAHWKIYQLDRWSKEGADRLYHQDKMIEITPIESEK